MDTNEIYSVVEKEIKRTGGMFLLRPCWVARTFLEPGKRLGLTEEEYNMGERGWICERWLGSETEVDNAVKAKNEGFSSLVIEGEEILLCDAIKSAGELILGKEYAGTHKTLGRLAKIYDYKSRIFYHLHQTQEEAAKVGANSKEEAYYFPEGVDMGAHPETFFGVHPYIVEQNRQKELLLPDLEKWESESILKHSRAYLNVPGDGFHLPAGVLHAPGTAVTIELQEPSDVMAVLQSKVDDIAIPKELLFKDVDKETRKKRGEQAVLDQLVWDLNGDPYFYENRHTPPVLITETASTASEEYWIYYNTTKFSGKRLIIKPGHTVLSKDLGVYNLLVWSGKGKADEFVIQGGNFGMDEILVTHDKAVSGVAFENTGNIDLEILKFFGPDINNSKIPYLKKYPG